LFILNHDRYFERSNQTHYTECGVKTELAMVVWKKFVIDVNC